MSVMALPVSVGLDAAVPDLWSPARAHGLAPDHA
jgi:hypothetical protein